jgi:hypothetical protein
MLLYAKQQLVCICLTPSSPHIILKQNYFYHGEKTITQTDGLAMGAPSSSILSEVFLQHIKYG